MATAIIAPLGTQWESYKADDVQEVPAIVPEPSRGGADRLLHRHRMALDAEIEHAAGLMLRQRDPEDEIYNRETLDRAIAFLKSHISYVWESRATTAPLPAIGPGPAKSIDLYWEQSSWKLLVNIPADKNSDATFYGDDYGKNKTEGSLDPNDISKAIVSWLTA